MDTGSIKSTPTRWHTAKKYDKKKNMLPLKPNEKRALMITKMIIYGLLAILIFYLLKWIFKF